MSRPVAQSPMMSLVLSCLDYGNVTLASIPQHLRRLQSVINAASQLIYPSSRFKWLIGKHLLRVIIQSVKIDSEARIHLPSRNLYQFTEPERMAGLVIILLLLLSQFSVKLLLLFIPVVFLISWDLYTSTIQDNKCMCLLVSEVLYCNYPVSVTSTIYSLERSASDLVVSQSSWVVLASHYVNDPYSWNGDGRSYRWTLPLNAQSVNQSVKQCYYIVSWYVTLWLLTGIWHLISSVVH